MAQQTAPTSALYSVTVAGLDPNQNSGFVTRPTAGQGGAGRLVVATGTVLFAATTATTVATRMVRIPSNAIVKSVAFALDLAGGTATTLTGATGLLFSDNALDGTSIINAGSLTPYSSSFFTATTAMAGYTTSFTNVTYLNSAGNSATDGYNVPSSSTLPIWLAVTQGGPGPVQTPGAWAGTGATSLTTSPSYHVGVDPGGFFDVFFQPTTTTSLSAAMNFTCEVTYVTT